LTGNSTLKRSIETRLQQAWYRDAAASRMLLPVAGLFALLSGVRRRLFKCGVLKTATVAAPVIVVGNITVGGTGKTPVVTWLASALRRRGYSPGVVSRGYRGKVGRKPLQVSLDSDPRIVGDEAILLAAQSGCPVIVHPDRVAAARKAVDLGADVVISDDGLQHYRLDRCVELAIVDSARGIGNGRLLPAGPLREPVSRLAGVDQILVQRHVDDAGHPYWRPESGTAIDFRLCVKPVVRLDRSAVRQLDEFAGQTVHAVAGIGDPERFFRMLVAHGMTVRRHPLADHAAIEPADIRFDDDLDVLMTEKDAVKCRWPEAGRCWYVPVEVEFEDDDGEQLLELIETKIGGPGGAER